MCCNFGGKKRLFIEKHLKSGHKLNQCIPKCRIKALKQIKRQKYKELQKLCSE